MAKMVAETKEQKLRRQREEKYAATMGRSGRHFRDGVGNKTPLEPPAGGKETPPEGASDLGEKLNSAAGGGAGADKTAIDRVTFSAPAEERWPARLDEYRKANGLRSTSEAIRALLVKGLK